MTRGRKARASRKQVQDAILHMVANPDARVRDVADKFDISLLTLRAYAYRWTKHKGEQKDPLPLSPLPGDDQPPPVLAPKPVFLLPPGDGAPATIRARYQLTRRFHELAQLWGDWIMK